MRTPMRSERERRASRAYTRRFATALLAYAALLAVSVTALNAGVAQPWRSLVAVAPMAAALFIPVALVRLLRDIDELQRRIHLEALAIGFAGGSLLTFSYGFLQVAGAPQLSWFFVWPVYATCWMAGSLVTSRRYGRGE